MDPNSIKVYLAKKELFFRALKKSLAYTTVSGSNLGSRNGKESRKDLNATVNEEACKYNVKR